MEVAELINFLKYLNPALFPTVQQTVDLLLREKNKTYYYKIINSTTSSDLTDIYVDKTSWDTNSEFSVIKIIIRTGICQELAFRLFYSIARALRFIFCNREFNKWYITDGWVCDIDLTYFNQKPPFNFYIPNLHIDLNETEMNERGVEISLDKNMELLLSRSFGKYYRARCEVTLNLNVKITKQTTKVKALCMALFDQQNNLLIERRIAQWPGNEMNVYTVKIKFNTLPENVLSFFHRMYLFWESSKKDLNYNGSWRLE